MRPSAMGNPMYLSRVRLRRSAQINALLPLLLEGNPHGQHPDHHLMWYLFAEGMEPVRGISSGAGRAGEHT